MKKTIFTIAMCFIALAASAQSFNHRAATNDKAPHFRWEQAMAMMNRENVDMYGHIGYFESISVEVPAQVQLCKGFFSAKVYNEDKENSPITCEVDKDHVLHIKFKNADVDLNSFDQAKIKVYAPMDMDINVNAELMIN